MISPRWSKVIRDLWGNRARTMLVVLSIAAGVFSVGVITGSQSVLSRELAQDYAAINPPSAIISCEPFDEELVEVVRRMGGVSEAQGQSHVAARIMVGPDEWRDIVLTAIPDFRGIRVNLIRPEEGEWPPPHREMLMERAALGVARAGVDETVTILTTGGKRHDLRVAGVVHDLNRFPSPLSGQVYGYVTFDTLEWLGQPRTMNQLLIVVEGDHTDTNHIWSVVREVEKKIEKGGREVFSVWVPEPGRHPATHLIDSMMWIFGILAILSLCLGGLLVINNMSAMLTQGIRQIGVMKAIGARTWQIIMMYMVTVLIYGVMALALAMPLAALGARALSLHIANMVNFNIGSYQVPPYVTGVQIGVGLAVPILAALCPVMAGTRITVREATTAYGLGNGYFGRGAIDPLLERVRCLSRPVLLSLRNTFRRKGRLALTLATLTLGGAIFIGVMSVHASLRSDLDRSLNFWGFDVSVSLDRPYRIEQIEREALSVPGVVKAESWGFHSARRLRPDGTESEHFGVVSPPAGTELLRPSIIKGRWLHPSDKNALVMNTDFLRNEPGIEIGDEVILKVNGYETTWQVVGLIQGTMSGPVVYANQPYFLHAVRLPGRANDLQVVTEYHDEAHQVEVSKRLEEHFKTIGLGMISVQTLAQTRDRIISNMMIVIGFLLVMALLMAVIAGLGLAGAMSLNVLERTREVGVMRAIGASNSAVQQVFILEGVVIGVMSWVLSVVLSVPIGKILGNAVGQALIEGPLDYIFPTGGVVLWLVLVTTLSVASSFLPAYSASRLSVRAILAYEG